MNTQPPLPDRHTDYEAWSLAIWERAVDRKRREQYAQRTPSAPKPYGGTLQNPARLNLNEVA